MFNSQGEVFVFDTAQGEDEPSKVRVKNFWTKDTLISVEGHHRVSFLELYQVLLCTNVATACNLEQKFEGKIFFAE